MIKGKSVLAVVSAVSGSKTLPRRDTRQLINKPLLLWTIYAARTSRLIDRIIVVCADNEARSLSHAHGLTAYSSGRTRENGIDRLVDSSLLVLKELPDYDFVVALDAGSPLLLSSDIDGMIELAARTDGTPVVAVSETRVSPSSLVVLDATRKMNRVFGNQDPLPANTRMYMTNHSIASSGVSYVRTHETFLTEDTHAYIMPPERALVVESKIDLAIAEGFLKLTGPAGALPMPFTQDVSQVR